MGKTRKVSECVNVRINVGNYQHIELTKCFEEEISYETEEELREFEDQLTTDLVSSLVRSMKKIPEQLGKGVANAQEIEESIAKAIPEWLAKSPVPNIANQAKKHNLRVAAEQKANKDKNDDIMNVEEVVKPSVEKQILDEEAQDDTVAGIEEPEVVVTEDMTNEDMFEDDEPAVASEAVEEVAQETINLDVKEDSAQPESTSEEKEEKEEKEEVKKGFDFFDDEDEDLFG